jgi:hypothetical protein
VLHRSYGVGLHQVWFEKVTKVSREAGNVLVAFWKRCAGATSPRGSHRLSLRQLAALPGKQHRHRFARCSCDGNRSLPVRICDASLFNVTPRAPPMPLISQRTLLLRTIELANAVDLAPACIAADTKIIQQREVHHFAVRRGNRPAPQVKPIQRPVATITTHNVREQAAAKRAARGGVPRSHAAIPRAVKK